MRLPPSVRRSLLLAASFASLCAQATAQEWLPLTIRGGHLTFPAIVEGIETTAMLDTGASGNSIDAAFAANAAIPLNGPEYEVTAAFSRKQIVRSAAALDVTLFGVDATLRDTPALSHPETPLLVGIRAFDGLIVQIDYPGSRMRVLPPRAVDLERQANVRITNVVSSSRPAIEVAFPGDEQVWMLLDTGASGDTMVTRAIAKKLGLLDRAAARSEERSDVHGAVAAVQVVPVPSLRIGPFELGGVPVAVPREGDALRLAWLSKTPPTGSHIARGVRVHGVVGYDVLRHFVVTLDYRSMKAHLGTPSPHPDARGGEKQTAAD